jgi:hypothetical protein
VIGLEEKKKYFKVDQKTLATALSYLCYKYMKFTSESGQTIYSFEDSDEFRKDLDVLNKLRKKNNTYKK